MRRIFGQLVLPTNAPSVCAGSVLVEMRDVSRADAPSKVLATQRQADITIYPGAQIPFECVAPETSAGCTLDLRAHIDLTGDGVVAAGDLLSTTSNPVSATGDHGPAQVLVQLIQTHPDCDGIISGSDGHGHRSGGGPAGSRQR